VLHFQDDMSKNNISKKFVRVGLPNPYAYFSWS
jgi:hypothetical protein